MPYTLGAAILNAARVVSAVTALEVYNPLVVYKIVLWLALVLGGIFIYRLVNWLIRSPPAALLAGVAYMAAPYLAVNIVHRGDFTEAFAQGILPICLYYTLRVYKNKFNVNAFCFAAIAWFSLATSHLITFAYASLFIGFLILLLQGKQALLQWKNFSYVALAYCLGCLLALWFLAPVALVEKFLFISKEIRNPFSYNWLTHLPTLLSVTSVVPPFSGNSCPISAAIGWPILLAVGFIIYALLTHNDAVSGESKMFVKILLLLFILVFFLTWSPVDFWRFLPKDLVIVQFTYRFLSQIAWIGAVLFGYAIYWLFKGRLDGRHVLVGTFLIVLALGPWLSSGNNAGNVVKIKSAEEINEEINNEEQAVSTSFVGPGCYTVIPSTVSTPIDQLGIEKNPLLYPPQIPLVYGDGWLFLNKDVNLPRALLIKNPDIKLHIEGEVPVDVYKTPIVLAMRINSYVVEKRIKPGNFSLEIPLSKVLNFDESANFRLSFFSNMAFIPKEKFPLSRDDRLLVVRAKVLRLTNFSSNFILPVDKCGQMGAEEMCQITLDKASYVYLPILYYPNLLGVKVNGHNTVYYPVSFSNEPLVLTAVRLSAGNNIIKVKFRGLVWANWISGISWICLLTFLIINSLLKIRRKLIAN